MARFGVSLERGLFEDLDRYRREGRHRSRSQAIGALVREYAVRERWRMGQDIAGTITLVYDHHQRELAGRLLAIQHDFHSLILASQHIHLDHHRCLEVLVVRGDGARAQRLRDLLGAAKGVKHAVLGGTAVGGHAL